MVIWSRLARWSRPLLLFSLLTAGWAAMLALTGGFEVFVGALRLSSRRPRNPAVIALLAGIAGWALLPSGERRRLQAGAWNGFRLGVVSLLHFTDRLRRFTPALAGAVIVLVVALGLSKGALVAGGSDSYGYLSQARLWSEGTLRVEQPIMGQLTRLPREAFAPLGYRPAPDGAAIVPVYPPGLPMLMAIFERLAGPKAVFLVVPLFGGLAVWLTYIMGARLAGPGVGVSAAILLATSPPFLYQLMFPMSDVPVAAWWALALALLLSERRDAALAAGLACGAAILTRPNLVLLAIIPGALLVWRASHERSVSSRAVQRALLFVAGIVPACIVVAAVNARWYGSSLGSGYGAFDALYRWEYFGPNLERYPRWLIDAHTPVVLLALVAPFLLERQSLANGRPLARRAIAIVWLMFIAAVVLCYLFYAPFDDWWYLRFLLPAFPPLLVLTAITLTGLTGRAGRHAQVFVTAAVVGLLAWRGVDYALRRSAFVFREGERKYPAIGDYIARRLPHDAVFLSVQHSGSVRYYSGRLTVRYDLIPPSELDRTIDDLRGLGRHPYLVVEVSEEEDFRDRFKDRSPLAALDWPPIARLQHASAVKIYDLERNGGQGRPPPDTETIY